MAKLRLHRGERRKLEFWSTGGICSFRTESMLALCWIEVHEVRAIRRETGRWVAWEVASLRVLVLGFSERQAQGYATDLGDSLIYNYNPLRLWSSNHSQL